MTDSDDERPFQLTMESLDQGLVEKARKTFLPSSPIRTFELLRGREEPFHRVTDILATPGRSPFIYGARGVGKTSLAHTAAWARHRSNSRPAIVACDPYKTFGDIILEAYAGLLQSNPTLRQTKKSLSLNIQNFFAGRKESTFEIPSSASINPSTAVSLIRHAESAMGSSMKAVVVVDELDQINDFKVKSQIAAFIKQLGDQECGVKFIFVGIADTVEELIEHHESISRNIGTIHLSRLEFESLEQIVLKGFEHLEIDIFQPFARRIAFLSDGFPHFVHLISLHTALFVLRQQRPPRKVSKSDLRAGIEESVKDSEAWLQRAYDKATKHRKDLYEPILWAIADHWQTQRSYDQIYESYERIMSHAGAESDLLPRDKFSSALQRLKQSAHGAEIEMPRQRWYRFRRSMLRGYCRMVAESKGIQVGLDYMDSREPL